MSTDPFPALVTFTDDGPTIVITGIQAWWDALKRPNDPLPPKGSATASTVPNPTAARTQAELRAAREFSDNLQQRIRARRLAEQD